jgi:hypothetical protein
MAAEIGPTEPWFGAIVGLFLLAAVFVTFWLLFGDPHKHRNPDRTNK